MTLRLVSATAVFVALTASAAAQEDWINWPAQHAERISRSTVVDGRIAGGRRLLNTERAFRYKVVATWFTPDVLRATAKTIQIRKRLTNQDAQALVTASEQPNSTVIMIELDPDEGSGVIPTDWEAFLQPRNNPDRAVRGTKAPQLREVGALAGTSPRNYDYDRFWMIFALTTDSGERLFANTDREAELVIRINDREGTVRWPILSATMR